LTGRPTTISGMNYWGTSTGGLPYPYPTNGGAVLSQALLNEGSYIRGALPGIWVPEHSEVHSDGVVYTGFNDLPSGTELLCKTGAYQNSSSQPRVLIDISNPWDN